MKKLSILMFVLMLMKCTMDEGPRYYIIDLPDGVTNILRYNQLLCEKIAETEGR
jgi:hypothetical protein